ncbi:MAG: pyruvate formate lyase family protein [Bacteroidota bacterium]
MDKQILIKYFKDFTRVYQKNTDIIKREVECLKVQYPFMFSTIEEGDLFVGKYEYPVVYFVPQTYSNRAGVGFAYVFDEVKYNELLQFDLSDIEKRELDELKSFWERENTAYKTRAAFSKEMQKALPTDNWIEEPGVAFPLYRMAGSILNYDFLLQNGISGILKIIEDKKKSKSEASVFNNGMITALDVFKSTCDYYALEIKSFSKNVKDKKYKEHLQKLHNSLIEIKTEKPKSLLAAIQLMFLYNSISGSLNYGRIDEYLSDFLIADLESGKITREEAQIYINGLWKMMIARNTVFDGRAIIGGKGRRNEKNADQFAVIAMEATRITNDILPQLTLRLYDGMNTELLEKAIDVIGEGNTFPMLYNDDVNINAVHKAFDISQKEAENYSPYGCGEYIIHNKSFGSPNGIINLLKSLEVTLNNGKEKITGREVGLKLGEAKDYKSYGDILNAYKKQTEYFIDQLALQQELGYNIAGETAPFLFLSILYDDCIENGKSIFNGGIKYLGGTLESYGNTNTADSFSAIKKLVFEEKVFSLEQLWEMMKANFVGYEKERQLMLHSPKYGNDIEIADSTAIDIHSHLCNYTRDQINKTSLHNYLIVNINNNANTVLGRTTLASADGRLENTSMANGNAATGGMDKNGITALLNSLVKLDSEIHAGAVQNLKLSKELFKKYKTKLIALLKGYFKSGGAQLMLTVLSKDDLKNARIRPELYPNLLVRVGGYSARFVELESDIQDEIISRTLY